jgi:peptide/nickel transport system permease protein
MTNPATAASSETAGGDARRVARLLPRGHRAVGSASRLSPIVAYTIRRLAAAVPVVLGVVLVTFLLLRLIPGDPARTLLGIHAPAAAVAALRRQLGLDKPLAGQLWSFLVALAHGNTGTSIYYRVATSSLIASRVAVTASLVGMATIFSIIITVPLAAVAAVKQDRPADHLVRLFSLFGLGMPSFFFGIVLILFFAVRLHWFAVGGWGISVADHLRSLVLPGLTAAIGIVPVLIRSLRVGMLEVFEADFVATAKSKGLRGPRVLFMHVARNALIPTLTLLGINIAYLIGGTVVIERVFALDGLGNLMLNAISFRDFPVVQGVTIVYAFAVVVVNLLTDLLAARLDPRIRLR